MKESETLVVRETHNPTIYFAHSQSNDTWYRVQVERREIVCSCPDYSYKRGKGTSCKHGDAVLSKLGFTDIAEYLELSLSC